MSQDRMNELHEELHEACRQVLRYHGSSKDLYNKAYSRMSKTTHAITDYQNSAELANEEQQQEFNDKRYVDGVYKGHLNSEGKWAVDGPGNGLGYHAGYLNPHLVCETEREAKRAATIACIAHSMGRQSLQRDFQKLMHLDPPALVSGYLTGGTEP